MVFQNFGFFQIIQSQINFNNLKLNLLIFNYFHIKMNQLQI